MTFIGSVTRSSSGSELSSKPSTSHEENDEFEGDLDPAWVFSSGGSAISQNGTPDIYSDVSAGSGYRLIQDPDDRPSWLLVQPEVTVVEMVKSIMLPTNMLIWARVGVRTWNAAAANNDYAAGIQIANDMGSGIPSANDRIRFELIESDPSERIPEVTVVESSATVVSEELTSYNMVNNGPFPYQYLAVHKLGSDYHFWIGNPQGSWNHVTSRTYLGAALSLVGFRFVQGAPQLPEPQ